MISHHDQDQLNDLIFSLQFTHISFRDKEDLMIQKTDQIPSVHGYVNDIAIHRLKC